MIQPSYVQRIFLWGWVFWLGISCLSAQHIERTYVKPEVDTARRVKPAVYPPSWWTQMQMDTVQFMLHGTRVSKGEIQQETEGIKILSIEQVENPNYAFVTAVMFVFTACDGGDDPMPIVPVETQLVEDFEAPNDVIDRATGTIVEERPFQYYSLEQNREVTEGDDWDLAFKGTTIRVNASKNVSAAIVTGVFDQLESVPASATFATDTDTEFAIPTGGGNGWYNYNPALNTITPIPGRVILVQTVEGNYVKMEILSYYKGNPPVAEIDPLTTPSAHYTFRFALQPNGSTEF